MVGGSADIQGAMMSEGLFRVIVAAQNEGDRSLLAEAITKGEPRVRVLSSSLEGLGSGGHEFDAVVVDFTAVDEPPGAILERTGPKRLICVAGDSSSVADLLRRRGADVLIKDAGGSYLDALPVRVKAIVEGAAGDIAEGVETEPLPNEYEQLTHTLFEHSPNMIFINTGGRIVYANRKCVEVMGYGREEIYSSSFNYMDVVSPECHDIVRLNFGLHLRGIEVEPYDYTLITKTGRRIEAAMASKLIQYRGKQAVLGIITDISRRKQIEESLTRSRDHLERQILQRTEELVRTNESLLTEIRERQRAEEALRESEERYRIISSMTSDYVYAMSCEERQKVEWVGGAFERITGYKAADVVTVEDWLTIIHPADRDTVREAGERMLSGMPVETEYRIRTREGQLRWLCDYVHPMRDEQTGLVVGAVGAVRDITERKESMKALKESELKFKTIFENAGGAIFIADTETGEIVECNTEAERLTGLSRERLIGIHQSQLHPPDKATVSKSKFRRHVEAGHNMDFEGEIQHASGRRIPVWISSHCLGLSHRKFIIGLFIDMAAKHRADQQRAALAEMLEERNRELESIIHVAGHDLRTPLVTICGFADELEQSCRQLGEMLDGNVAGAGLKKQARSIVLEDIPEAVGLISASAAKLNSLVDGLTRLSRLDHTDLTMTPIDMNAMLADIVKTLTYQAKHHKAEFRIEPLPNGFGDEQQVGQVFSNLLENAVKYLDPARAGVIRVSGSQSEDQTIYCVEDNGKGIDANNLPHIFKMYYRVDPMSTEGQGLGLAIVRRMVSRHNGKIWAESEPGHGSRFFVALPFPAV